MKKENIQIKHHLSKNKTVAFILSLFIILIISGCSGGENTVTKNKETVNESSAFKLASLEIGYNAPEQSLVNTFDNLLKDLLVKCPNETEEQIAGYIFKGKELIEKDGGSITLLQVANNINDSIPIEAIGVASCAEVTAAFVTLTNYK